MWLKRPIDRGPEGAKNRAIMIGIILSLSFFVIISRLFYLMILQHNELTKKADKQHYKVIIVEPKRGTIYDRKMRELAVNVDVESLYGVPSEMENLKAVAVKLSTVLNKNPSDLIKRFEEPKPFMWIDRKLDPIRVEKIKELDLSNREIGFLTESKRFYPKRFLAGQLLGFAGIDNQGLEGIELSYERYIRAGGGWKIVERDATGREIFSTRSKGLPPAPGNDIILTIDETIQYIAEKELDKIMAKTGASGSVAIVANPRTGEILAMAVRPEFNPNIPASYPPSVRKNRAITDIYEPGSTFKFVIAAAALEEGKVNLSDRFDCSSGAIEVGGKVIRDVHRNGVLTFTEVIQKSSNVGTIQIAARLEKEAIFKYIKLFSFGEKTGIDLLGEVVGLVREPSKWSATSMGAIPIGQEIAVTPLQMLMALSSIASNGYLMKPYIVSEIRDHEGKVIKKTSPHIVRKVLSEATVKMLKDILGTVVMAGGTGRSAAIEGNPVAGKTGTAQKFDFSIKRYSKQKYVSSFVGFVPADDPRLAIIVVVDEPKGEIYGGRVAAPVFKNIAEQSMAYLNIPVNTGMHVVFTNGNDFYGVQ